MIAQVPGYPRREEVPAPVSSQAGVASFITCDCGNGWQATKTRHGVMCDICYRDFFSERLIHD